MPRNVSSATMREFTGGLNLRAGQFQLAPNESPDILNMDVDPRGGIRLRKGVSPWGDTYDGPIHSVMAFYGPASDQVLVASGSQVAYSTGGPWTDFVELNTVTDPVIAAQFKSHLYLQNGTDKPVKWTGATASRLNQGYSNNFDTPTDGNMPIGRAVAAHNGHMFVANTLEGGTRFPSRVRFSHPNFPESYRQQDWFDVDPGVDGDEIIALAPFTDHLLVFKKKSVYIIYGFDADSFQLQALSREVGAVSPNAVATTPSAIYFFAWPSGLMRYDGRGLSWAFEKLVPLLDSGDIPQNRLDEVSAAWIQNRVWVSVPNLDGDRTTYVMDPTLGKTGSWTRYDLDVGNLFQFGSDDGDRLPLAVYGDRLLRLENFEQEYDDFGDGAVHIPSRYVTPWIDAGETAIKKRWRRPWFVFQGKTADVVEVAVYRDYDPYQRAKTFYEQVQRQGGEWLWDGDDLEWDGTDPDDPTTVLVWGGEGKSQQIQRGATLGLAHSVQLAFRGPESIAAWGLDNITFTFIPRRLR